MAKLIAWPGLGISPHQAPRQSRPATALPCALTNQGARRNTASQPAGDGAH